MLYAQINNNLVFLSVMESHPDSAHEDLRLDRPFPGLVAYCDSLNLENMSKKVKIITYTCS